MMTLKEYIDADNENYCRCFTGDKTDDCYWRLAEE